MRTSWLVLSALLLLAAPGCGDDTTEGADMAVSNIDMAMTMPGDMNKATCAGQINCGTACILSPKPGVSLMDCANACAAPLTGAAQQAFGALVTCIFSTCGTDGGTIDKACAGAAISKGPPAGACYSDVTTCSTL
jgi:hypothetical protein